jgi:hypothetical protein
MGGHSIDEQFPKKMSQSQLDNWLCGRKQDDRLENGHQHGYSGDWQTIKCIDLKNKTFNNYDDAWDYAVTNAEKWADAVAVYYTKIDESIINKKLSKDGQRLLALKENHFELTKNLHAAINNAKSNSVSCKACSSKVNRAYIRLALCPVCNETLLSATALKRLDALNTKITALKKSIKQKRQKLEALQAKKAKVYTLVVGIAAS